MFVIVDRKTNKLIERAKFIDEARERQRVLGVDTVAVKLAADWKGANKMDVGYSLHQVTGPKADKEKYPSINQDRNAGGSVQGFVADIHDERGKVILTTVTEPTPEALDNRLDAVLKQYDKA